MFAERRVNDAGAQKSGGEAAPSAIGKPRSRLRERIIAAASELFHRHGIRGVGVDAIVEAAGTNKMTLYRHFGSKDELILACLKTVACEADAIWDGLKRAHPEDKTARLRAWVGIAAECVGGDERGCSFVNAAVELTEGESPARSMIEAFKRQQHDRLAALCRGAAVSHPELLADALVLLFEGARASRNVGVEEPSARFARLADAIIVSFAKRA